MTHERTALRRRTRERLASVLGYIEQVRDRDAYNIRVCVCIKHANAPCVSMSGSLSATDRAAAISAHAASQRWDTVLIFTKSHSNWHMRVTARLRIGNLVFSMFTFNVYPSGRLLVRESIINTVLRTESYRYFQACRAALINASQ